MSYLVNRFLTNSRRHLNTIIIAIHLLKFTGWVGTVAALAICAVRIFGWAGEALGVWLVLTGIGGAAGFVIGWRRRMNIEATARWLDEDQNNAEAFSAALVCQARNCSETLDELVMERAENCLDNLKPIHWPTRYLIRRIAITGGLLLGAVAAVQWSPPSALNLSRYIISEKVVDSTPVNPKRDMGRLQERKMAGEFQKTLESQNRTFFRFLWKNAGPGGKLENTKNKDYKGGTVPGQEPGKIICMKQEIPEVEYVLPGENATVPLARILPDFQRAAESVLSRNGVPREYEDFVHNYFLELSREIKGGLPESEGNL